MRLFNIFRKNINAKKLNSWFHHVAFFLGILLMAFSLTTLYYQVQKIYDKITLKNIGNKKAKIVKYRPRYHKKYGNFFSIENIVIPVYKKTSSFHKVVMDFHIVSSNNTIKNYFENDHNTHLIYDRINSHLAPMALEFPLEEEGKDVIKEKVRSEINQLVKELKIEGEIEKVYIERILAG